LYRNIYLAYNFDDLLKPKESNNTNGFNKCIK
jgi:hypothetical protein